MAKVPLCSYWKRLIKSSAWNDSGLLPRIPLASRDDLIDAIARLPKVAEHIHLPLQSGSNRILKAMRRAYTAEQYVDLVRRIRHARRGYRDYHRYHRGISR